jgi:glycosyltransferase involved in cell wall biosynthesis
MSKGGMPDGGAVEPHRSAARTETRQPVPITVVASSMDGGGSERQTIAILRHLDRRRFLPSLWLIHRRGALLGDVPSDVPIEAFDDRPVPAAWHWPGRMLQRLSQSLLEHLLRNRSQLVYDRTFHATLITAPAAHRIACPRVSTIVSPPEHDFVRSKERFAWLKRRMLRRAYATAAATLCVSDVVAQSASRFYSLPHSQFQVLASGIDIERIEQMALEPLPQPWVQWRREYASTPAVALVGRCTAEKGHRHFLHALAAIRTSRRIDGWMIGDGPLRDTLQAESESIGLGTSAHWLGHLSNPYPMMNAVDAIVVPSDYEGLANVILEAFVLGTPVIASASAASGLLDEGRGMVLPANGPDGKSLNVAESLSYSLSESLSYSLSESLSHSLSHSPQAVRRAPVGNDATLNWVRQNYSVQARVAALEQVFEDAIEKKRLQA